MQQAIDFILVNILEAPDALLTGWMAVRGFPNVLLRKKIVSKDSGQDPASQDPEAADQAKVRFHDDGSSQRDSVSQQDGSQLEPVSSASKINADNANNSSYDKNVNYACSKDNRNSVRGTSCSDSLQPVASKTWSDFDCQFPGWDQGQACFEPQ